MNWKSVLSSGAAALAVTGAIATLSPIESIDAAPAKKAAKKPAKKPAANANMVALRIALPKPAFMGTPKNIPPGTTVEKPTGKPRPLFFAPRGTTNVALKKPVTASDAFPTTGELSQITDGDKEANDGSFVELGPGKQWAQIDLGKTYSLYAIVVWHYHGEARVYRDVVVQVSNDPDFISGVKTVYNNDQDNSAGLGIGRDREFFELSDGRLMNAKGVKGRYVRCYTAGNTSDDLNRFTEVEVYGK